MFAKLTEKISKKAEKAMNSLKSSNLIKYFHNLGKLLVVYIVIFQLFTQPMAALAQSKPVLQASRQSQRLVKSNVKPKLTEDNFEGFMPTLEKKARQAVSTALGVDIPLPQVFGENGKLQSLLAGGDGNSPADKNKQLIEAA